ncbi:alpha/beta family hydrolase [Kangiella shandongensis]|uniref:alpha/beta family hydrolase n=1 Tax=Kangiella shandongensis TaxID=2763258 RepID=UPI001CC005AC|nr:alpha/beta family hydrolase [Kangiella shandongensis]
MKEQKATLILAHGAGADSQSDFMQFMVKHIACQQIDVMTFDFPYMERRQQTGKKSPPDRMPKLIESFKQQIDKASSGNLFIGGKSMGGRVASMIADDVGAGGVICMGYPFHPPGKPEKTRTAHLQTLTTPALILQGTRDPFGKPHEVEQYALSEAIQVDWLDDGNHSFETLKRSEVSTEATWYLAAQKAQQFILSH